MRSGRSGLSVLIVVLLLAVAGPARAADERPVGIVDDVVVVRAREILPGRSGGSAEDPACAWELIIEDDLVQGGVYSLEGERLYSDTGRWFQKNCGSGPVEINGVFVVPEGGGFLVPDLVAQALDALDPRLPTWRASPDGVGVPMVAQMPVWLWVDPGYWDGHFAARAVTPSGRVWAEAAAIPVSTVWHMGDGSTVECRGGGEPFDGEASPPCSHVFEHSTAGGGEFSVMATVTFDVLATSSLDPTPQIAGQISRTSAVVGVSVGEIQAVETAGGT